jgi:PAS domain S-box-containing protein
MKDEMSTYIEIAEKLHKLKQSIPINGDSQSVAILSDIEHHLDSLQNENLNLRKQLNQKKEQLQSNLNTLDLINRFSNDIVWQMDMNLNFTFITQSVQKVLGYEPNEVIGSSIRNYLNPDGVEKMKQVVQDKTRSKNAGKYTEYRMLHKNGSLIPVEVSSTMIINAQGKPNGFIGVTREISDREKNDRETERQLHELKILSDTAVELLQLPDDKNIYSFLASKIHQLISSGIVIVNSFSEEEQMFTVENIRDLSPLLNKVLRILGRHPVGMKSPINQEGKNEMLSRKLESGPKNFYELTVGKIPKVISKKLDSLLNIGAIYGMGISKDNTLFGNVVIILPKNNPLSNVEIIQTLVNQAATVVQKRIAVAARKESEDKLTLAVKSSGIGIYDLNIPSGKIYCSEEFAKMLGYDSSVRVMELESLRTKLHPDDKKKALHKFNQFLEGKDAFYQNEFRLQKTDGNWCYVLTNGKTTESDNNGIPIRIIGTHTDITSIKETEEELKLYKEHLEEIVKERTKELNHTNEQLIATNEEFKATNDELVNAYKRIEENETKFRSFIEQSPVGFTLTDERGTLIEWNRALEKITGLKKEHCLNKPAWEIYYEVLDNQNDFSFSREQFKEGVKNLLNNGQADFLQKSILNKFNLNNGKTKYGQGIIFSIKTHAGNLTGLIVEDVTKQQEAEKEILEALNKEKELNELKSSFVSMTSHQFKTPLTTILSSTELMEMYLSKVPGEIKQKVENHLGKISSEVIHMNNMINDFLILEKFEIGKTPFNPGNFDLIRLAEELIRTHFDLKKQQRKIDFHVHGHSYDFYGDSKLIRHVIMNLLSNAVKYSKGNPDLTITFHEKKITISVLDDGVGIPEKDHDSLFEPFYRAGNVQTKKGTGMGLAIAKKFVEQHNGHISFKTETGKGTKFIVDLPVEKK